MWWYDSILWFYQQPSQNHRIMIDHILYVNVNLQPIPHSWHPPPTPPPMYALWTGTLSYMAMLYILVNTTLSLTEMVFQMKQPLTSNTCGYCFTQLVWGRYITGCHYHLLYCSDYIINYSGSSLVMLYWDLSGADAPENEYTERSKTSPVEIHCLHELKKGAQQGTDVN